jgi:hypothetical protein
MKTIFKTKKHLTYFIRTNIPFAVKPKRKANTVFVDVFTSGHAMQTVIETLADRLWEEMAQPKKPFEPIKQRLLSYMNEETAELITTEILSLINGNDIQK